MAESLQEESILSRQAPTRTRRATGCKTSRGGIIGPHPHGSGNKTTWLRFQHHRRDFTHESTSNTKQEQSQTSYFVGNLKTSQIQSAKFAERILKIGASTKSFNRQTGPRVDQYLEFQAEVVQEQAPEPVREQVHQPDTIQPRINLGTQPHVNQELLTLLTPLSQLLSPLSFLQDSDLQGKTSTVGERQ